MEDNHVDFDLPNGGRKTVFIKNGKEVPYDACSSSPLPEAKRALRNFNYIDSSDTFKLDDYVIKQGIHHFFKKK